jgi:hypothetical protein
MFFFGAHMRRTRLYLLNPGATTNHWCVYTYPNGLGMLSGPWSSTI